MKNAKKILGILLALVALSLVMSLSIFAEEATEPVACAHPVDAYDWNIVGCSECGTLAVLDEGSTNVSSNLGYKIFYATSLNDLSNTNYDVIRLKNNISLPSGGKITNANAIIDLGGNVLYRNGGWLGLRVAAAKGFVNGYVYKTNGGSQIMAVTSIEFMEDVTLAANSTSGNNATGLIMNTAGAYLGSMKNVTICAGVLNDLNSNNFDFVNVGTNGIYNHGIELAQGTIGSMENVKISTYGQAITCSAKIGTMTNCVFSGDNIALNITTLQSEMKFVDCEIHSKNLAIYIANAVESTEEAPVCFEIGNTKFVTDGAVYDISSHIIENEMFADLTSAKALVNGRLYTSLEDAVNALKASTEEVTTFALIADLAVDATIVVDKKVNFSFGGASYDVPVYGTNQVTHKTVTGYTVTSSVDVVFNVVEGGDLTISGAGTLEGTENAIVADGGVVVITAGTYVGYNPRDFVSTESCVVNNEGVYTIAAEHDYDDDVGADKTNYQVDGVCNNCGFVRGTYAVNNVYYATIEEALAAAIASGKQIVLAADIVLDGEVVWDFTGATFNFNNLTVTGNLSIVGGTFSQDVSEYLADGYCCHKNDKNLYVVTAHVLSDATCTTPATCPECGVTEGEALGHDYVVTDKADATAEADGYIEYTCNNCGDKYRDIIAAHVHDFVLVEKVDATCTTDGYASYKCSIEDCGVIKTEEFLSTGHGYSWNINGTGEYGCPACGANDFVILVNSASGIQNAPEGSIVRLTTDLNITSLIKSEKAILIDLGGHTITSSAGCKWSALVLYKATGLVNGTIVHNGGTNAIKAYNVGMLEDLVVDVPSALNGVGGITLYGPRNGVPSYLGSVKNVTIKGTGLNNHGFEAQDTSSTIGNFENVKIYSNGQAITLKAPIGTMTNCVFSGNNVGLAISYLQGEFKLVNCEIYGGTLAVQISSANSESSPAFVFDAATTFVTDGVIYDIEDSIEANPDYDFSALTSTVALVNGHLFSSLADAVEALKASTAEVTTFALMQDLVVTETIEIGKKVNFSLGGGTYKVPVFGYFDKFESVTVPGCVITSEAFGAIFNVVEGGTLTLSGDGIVNSVLSDNGTAIVVNGGDVVINGGNYTNKGAGDIIVVNSGNVEINKGNFYAYNPEAYVVTGNSHISFADNTYAVAPHTWDKATCTTPKTCSVCGATEGEALGHNYVAGEPAEDGSITYTCSACGDAYVINNSAVNGEYYMDTEKVVFADGVLTAMGSEFTYTYNVTTGMIDTNTPMIYFVVRNGVIYFKDATPLHQHTGEGYVAEEQADGSINYVCPFCGTVMYVINNSAINGEYYLGTDLVVFNNGVLSAMGGEFTYTYNATTGMIDTNNPMIYFVVRNGVIYFKDATPLHQHNEDTLFTEVTEPTCDKEGYTTYICQFCGPLYDADIVPATGHSYVEAERTETEVFYICSECGDTYSEDVITHTHTEVEIPAVLPTPSVVGMTAGVQCSECGEVIVAPQEVTVTDVVKGNGFEFKAISLLLGKNISIDYKAQVPAGYTNVYAVFEFADFPESVVSEFTTESGRYVFNFSGTRIHMMNDNIAAYLYGVNANGEYERFVYSTYSVVTYCANQLKKTDTITAKLKTALSDLLVLGAETQKFVNKNIKDADLVTTIIKNMGYTLTPSTFTSIPDACNKQEVTGTKVETTDWRSASLLLGEQTKIQLKFISDDIENVTVKIFVPNVVNANVIDEYEFTTEDFEYEASSGRYVVTFDQLTAIQYDTQITAKLYANGEEIGRTFKYSINTYLYKNYGTLDIAKALYLYGESIKAYAGK